MLPKIRFHDLRHTCATLLLSRGVSPRMVMDSHMPVVTFVVVLWIWLRPGLPLQMHCTLHVQNGQGQMYY